ncbi:TonB-dependent siderophore receptor [Stenotrophomonas maltophilia]|uniref:TonB-dependent siderophore receptor n=1 Tax=Stenotrophomonas maltophilia TaxID=40324 RepID=UPI0009A22E4D|nr:TonB-dependent siderophore receptor [Stenotrophomonas maltophilia]
MSTQSLPVRAGLFRAPLSTLALALAAALSGALPTLAQADEARTLDTVQVTAPIATESGSATKTDTPLREIPQSISVITDRQMRDRGIHGVEEAVWYTAGAQGGQYGEDTRSDWLLVRGFKPARYLDGLATVEGTWTGESRIEPYGLERIDVLKGPASVNYGAMPPGGLVNFVSKRPSANPLQDVELQVGNYGLKQAAFDIGGALNDSGSVLYRLVGLARNSDNVIDQVHDDRYYLAPSITWTPDEANSLTVLARYQKNDTVETGGFLPYQGTVVPGANGRYISRHFFSGEPGVNDYTKEAASLGYEFRHDFGDGTVFNQNVRYSWAEVDASHGSLGLFGLAAPDSTELVRYYYPRMDTSESVAIDNNLTFRFHSGRVEHTVLAGLDYRRARDDYASAFLFGAPGIDAYNPVYGAPVQVPDYTSRQVQTQGTLGLYLQDQIRIDRWLVTLAGRQDWVGTDTEQRIGGTGTAHQSDDQFSGRVGVNYLFDNGVSPYVSWSQSFQTTIGTDFEGRAFVPTTGEQFEAGVKYQPEGGRLLLTAAAYQIEQDNTLTVDPQHTLFSIQQGQTRVRGAELEGRWNIGQGLSVYGSYTRLDAKVRRSTDAASLGKRVALVPKESASLGADYTFTSGALSGFGFGAGVRYNGGIYGDIYNDWYTPSFTLFDASVHYDRGPWRLQVNAANAADKKYVSACNSATWCYYGYPRTVTASLRYQW